MQPVLESPSTIPGLDGDEEGARIIAEELRLLQTVVAALESAHRSRADEKDARIRDDALLLELRDDVAVAKPEDLPALFEQMHHLGALRAQRGRSASGSVDLASPYFGHLRLVEHGKRRDVLVGGRSYLDPAAGIRIVDWRNAPVSRIYYRYQEGDDYEETLGDRLVEGKVTARRSVSIVHGQLVRVAAPQGTFVRKANGDWHRVSQVRARLSTESKRAMLGVGADGQLRTDKHLPAIAAMLDQKQFELIARPGSGLVVVEGSAGSGKTTVGLHRAAYLAFADPRRFRPDKMLIVVSHDALRHYVSHVLPSLGVEGTATTTFARLSTRCIVTLFPRLPTSTSDATPAVVARAKTHSAMLRALEAHKRRVDARIDAKVKSTMEKWPEGRAVIDAWQATTGMVPDARVSALAQWLVGRRKLGTATPDDLPAVTRSALEALGHDLRSDTRAVAAAWDDILTSRERLTETFANVPGFGPGQLEQVHDWCVRQARIRSEGDRDGDTPTLDAEDRAILLRLWQLLRGPLVDPSGSQIVFSHVFVDEVQDASPLELRVLLDLADRERCVTLAGDAAQRMLEDDDDRGELDWTALLGDLGVSHTKLEPLKVSYRSTAEITAFARNVLGPFAHEAEPIATRHGPPVELFEHASTGEAVAFLADALKELAQNEPDANVAILARFAPQADVYYEGLLRAEVPNVRRVAKLDFTWSAGFDVTDIRQTKGLEFDEVVLVETTASSFPNVPQARHALYVGATRAAHQLWCVTGESPSPIVTAALTAAVTSGPD